LLDDQVMQGVPLMEPA